MKLTEEERRIFFTMGEISEKKTPKSGCLSVVLAIIVFACLM